MRTTIDSLLSWFRTLPASRRTLLLLFSLCAGCLVASWITRPAAYIGQRGIRDTPSFAPIPPGTQPDAELKAQWERIKQSRKAASAGPVAVGGEALGLATDESGYATPLIAHAAELAVATKEVARSRSTLEEILGRHHGYGAKIRQGSQPAPPPASAAPPRPPPRFT